MNLQKLPTSLKYKVDCQGVVQIGGLVLGYPWEVPVRLRLISLLYSLKFSLELKKQKTCLILLSLFIFSCFRMGRLLVKFVGFY